MARERGAALTAVRGLVFEGPERPLVVEDLELDAPAAGEVLVRMVASGVCHSDLHVVDGDWQRPAGVVLGHEGAAIVEALGPGIASGVSSPGPRIGDLVVLAWTAPCTRCLACDRGEPWLCAAPDGGGHRLDPSLARLHRRGGGRIGAYSGIGTFCTRQVVARSAAIAVDPATPFEVAALIGCAAATGIGAVRNTAGVTAGDAVVILGLGGVGLAATVAAVASGASPVVAVDVEPARRATAMHLGATAAVGPMELPAVTRSMPGAGADHVLECVGRVGTVELAVEAVRPGDRSRSSA